MPHLRERSAVAIIGKLSKLWPIVGVLGLRQVGKSTLLHKLLNIPSGVTLDDLYAREEAIHSPNTFLAKAGTPYVIDEVQKAPPLFDALKLKVDQKRIPGSYYVTGSTSFSAKIGIRESLTGRIGMIELLPMTLSELNNIPFKPIKQLSQPIASDKLKPRFTHEELIACARTGGLPVPAFLRDDNQRELYWRSWLDTTIHRDLARFFPRGFKPDLVESIIDTMAAILRQGELPTLKHFPQSARILRTYLSAMEDIFLLRKIVCHPAGNAKEVWLFKDSGLANYLMQQQYGNETTHSLIRHSILNEICAQAEYQGKHLRLLYYKTATGSPIDFILEGVPFRIVTSAEALARQQKWEERPLISAMEKLDSKFGYLVGPVNQAVLPPKKGGLGLLPWTAWS